jgi:hypothetical protein
MAPPKERYIAYQETTGAQSGFQIGQDVVDREGNWIGIVQARFSHYLLVDSRSPNTLCFLQIKLSCNSSFALDSKMGKTGKDLSAPLTDPQAGKSPSDFEVFNR